MTESTIGVFCGDVVYFLIKDELQFKVCDIEAGRRLAFHHKNRSRMIGISGAFHNAVIDVANFGDMVPGTIVFFGEANVSDDEIVFECGEDPPVFKFLSCKSFMLYAEESREDDDKDECRITFRDTLSSKRVLFTNIDSNSDLRDKLRKIEKYVRDGMYAKSSDERLLLQVTVCSLDTEKIEIDARNVYLFDDREVLYDKYAQDFVKSF